MLNRIRKLEKAAAARRNTDKPLIVWQAMAAPAGTFTPEQQAQMAAARAEGRVVIRVEYGDWK